MTTGQVLGDDGDVLDEDLEIVDEDEIPADDAAVRRAEWRGPSARRWAVFVVLALVAVVIDQLSKAWVISQLAPGAGMVVIPDCSTSCTARTRGSCSGCSRSPRPRSRSCPWA